MIRRLFNVCLFACTLALAVRASPVSTSTDPSTTTLTPTATTPSLNRDITTINNAIANSSKLPQMSSDPERSLVSTAQDSLAYTPSTEHSDTPKAQTVTAGSTSGPAYDATTSSNSETSPSSVGSRISTESTTIPNKLEAHATNTVSTSETDSMRYPASTSGPRQNESQEDNDQERFMKDVFDKRKAPEPFFAPIDLFGSKSRTDTKDLDDTDALLEDIRIKSHIKKDTEPFFAPFDVFHIKTSEQLVKDRPSHTVIDETRTSLHTEKDTEPFYAPVDVFHAKTREQFNQRFQKSSESVAAEDNDETDDLIAIINKHRDDNANSDKSENKEREKDDLFEVLRKNRQDKFQYPPLKKHDEDADSAPTKLESKNSQDASSKDLQRDIPQSEPTSSENSGLFSDADITVVLAVAASVVGLLLVLLIVVSFVWCHYFSAQARAKRKEKDTTTPNIQINRWDPQMLRPCKDSLDAFMFGPPVPSVSELFTKY